MNNNNQIAATIKGFDNNLEGTKTFPEAQQRELVESTTPVMIVRGLHPGERTLIFGLVVLGCGDRLLQHPSRQSLRLRIGVTERGRAGLRG